MYATPPAIRTDPATGFVDLSATSDPDSFPPNSPPPTGYDKTSTGVSLHVFSLAGKFAFIEALKKCWPNVSRACGEVGIDRRTLNNHLGIDPKFKQMFDDLVESKIDHLENVMFENGQKPNGFMDRIALARAYRAWRFNPASNVQVNVVLDDKAALRKREALPTVVDAELVQDMGVAVKNLHPKDVEKLIDSPSKKDSQSPHGQGG